MSASPNATEEAERAGFIQRLCDADIELVIVGGFAAMLHGPSLVTRDLDVCAVLTAENVRKLRLAFRDAHPA